MDEEEEEEDEEKDEEEEPTCVVQDAIYDHIGPDFQCQLHDLSIMCAIRSQYKALEHIETVVWAAM